MPNPCPAPLAQTIDHPMDRHPHEFEHGFYVSDHPGQGGVQGFCWFASAQEAIDWLVNELPALFDDGDAALSQSLAAASRGITTLGALPLERVNAIAEGYFEVRWAGTFLELAESDHPFAREIQMDFHDMVFPDERGQGPEGTWLEDFAYHLHNYRSD